MSSFSNPLTEYSPQMEFPQEPGGGYGSRASVFHESEEMEWASELLEVHDEGELDHFLGDLIKGAANAIGKVVSSPIGKAIGGVLKTVAGKALPLAGGALGGLVGGPLGAQIGSGLASMAGQSLGLELEGLSAEDREFEASRQFVRFAAETVKKALEAAPEGGHDAAVHAAAVEAARLYAPGLMSHERKCHCHSGRWIRRNGQIILLGV
ncbi:MAG TPA: hypothetical protein VKB88_27035 [Bryobacteraceae bacterium]|nr:hypothetical protein [Bryobacteraceae bacterium]